MFKHFCLLLLLLSRSIQSNLKQLKCYRKISDSLDTTKLILQFHILFTEYHVSNFVYMQAAKTHVRLHICAGWSKISFIANTISIFLIHILIAPQHKIYNNVVCAARKASDQPAHTRSLIRAFASRLDIL